VCARVCVRVCVRVFVCAYVCTCACVMHVWVCVCGVCVYMSAYLCDQMHSYMQCSNVTK